MTTSHSAHPEPPLPTHKPNAFRFKRKKSSESPTSDPSGPKRRPHHHRHRSHRRHHHRHDSSRSRPVFHSPEPEQPLDPETAFRESLFDALADDEGAAFWESVYGQPVHTYSPYLPSANTSDGTQRTQSPPLERMTDDEYASYVRSKMWEKSHQHIAEERHRREQERARQKEREEEGKRWERMVEQALHRGQERRTKNRWKDVWERYLRGWESLARSKVEGEWKLIKDKIPWPAETGRYTGTEEVERFFKHAPQPEDPNGEVNRVKMLKLERVRWHPDKFLQRAGGQGLDKETIAAVTAIFQIIDRLWSEISHA
ncbi:MAG: hypothetical protein Q9219_004158 [cf. Caloplaca sp. 3 TL-2023]